MRKNPAKVLIVDDDKEFALVVGTLLETEGFASLHTEIGSEANQLCRKEDVDVVLLDLVRPAYVDLGTSAHFLAVDDRRSLSDEVSVAAAVNRACSIVVHVEVQVLLSDDFHCLVGAFLDYKVQPAFGHIV